MNAPKKPGTDLSALKARLAKKSGGDAGAPAPAAPAAAEPSAPAAAAAPRPPARPGAPRKPAADPNFIPAPGEQAPAAAPEFIPAPGEVAPAHVDIPAPGEAAAAPRRQQFQADEGAAPFSAGGSFDPTAGIIDSGGEVQERGNKGLIALAAGASLILGLVFGYVLHQITSKRTLVDQGHAKGEVMLAEVSKVAEMRKGISLKMADLNKLIATDPAKGATELVTMLTTNFEKTPQVDNLFGWQLAAVHPDGIKKTFDLYEEANGLKLDLGYLATVVNGNIKPLAAGGPRSFAVMFKGRGVMLVERLEPMCGDPKAPAACPEGKEGDAIGFNIRTDTSGQPVFAPIGTEEGQIQALTGEGTVYSYIVGLNPENNAKIFVNGLMGRINERLEAMSKAEARALKALKRYSDDPNVDAPAGEID